MCWNAPARATQHWPRPWRMLVTETSEATLTEILDAALGSDRRKLDRFFARVERSARPPCATAHGWQTTRRRKASPQISAPHWRAEIEQLRASARLAGRRRQDAMSRAAGASGDGSWRDIDDGFARWDAVLLTTEGEPRKKLATKTLADARPDLLDYLTALQDALLRRRRTAHAPPAPPS